MDFGGQIDGDGRVGDVSCLRCGYSLYLQPVRGKCPECGRSVHDSLQGHYLQYAPPWWVLRLSLGLALIAVGTAIVVLFSLAILVPNSHPAPPFLGVFPFAGVVIGAIGVLLFSMREPNAVARSRWAVFARVALLAWVLMGALEARQHSILNVEYYVRAILFPSVAHLIAGFTVVVATIARLRQLLQRIPRPRLLRYATAVQVAIIGLGGARLAFDVVLARMRVTGAGSSGWALLGNAMGMLPWLLLIALAALMIAAMFFVLLIMGLAALDRVLRSSPEEAVSA